MNSSLFENSVSLEMLPLAARIRPKNFKDILGQSHFISDQSQLFRVIQSGHPLNMIFWGPPGTGKTSLALSMAENLKLDFIQLNAVDAGVKDLKSACEKGLNNKIQYQKKTILFVDEIHRFNKSQQDVLLPYIEKGDIYLIGATTELPSYELNKALMSRCHVVEFKKLDIQALLQILTKASQSYDIKLEQILDEESLIVLLELADGDARILLNKAEILFQIYTVKNSNDSFPLKTSDLSRILGQKILNYDKKSNQHFDCISAFIKSMRGSDPDAALYYCARMLEGGEDPIYIARRMIIFASEDIGNADPRALMLAVSGLQAIEAIGMPEARIHLGQVISYLASCPKSNKSYLAINKAIDYVKATGTADIPLNLQSAQKGQGYLYPHDYPRSYVKQNYWPEQLKPQSFYEPSSAGFEKNIFEYLNWLQRSESEIKK